MILYYLFILLFINNIPLNISPSTLARKILQ